MSEGAHTKLNLPSGSVPYDYLSILQQAADERRVLEGAGGSTRVLTLEDTIIPPSEEGVEGSKWGNPVKTNEPTLSSTPDLTGVAIWSQQLGSDIVSFFIGQGITGSVSEGGAVNTNEELAYIQLAAQMHATGAEEPSSGDTVTVTGTGVNIGSAFQTWLDSFATDFDPAALFPTEQQVQDRQNLQSVDPESVKVALLSMANLDSLNLDPVMKEFLLGKLDQLAHTLALVNQAGGSGYLNMTTPELLLPLLMAPLDVTSDLTLSTDQRDALMSALIQISNGIAENNFKALIQTETPSLEFLTLTSGDSAKLASVLKVMCQTVNLVIDLPPETLSGIMDAVGAELATIDPEMLSTMDDATLQQTLNSAFDNALASVNVSDEMKAALKGALLPAIAAAMSQVFTEKLMADLHSADSTTVLNSLTLLTGVDTDPSLTPADRAVVRDYLKAMTAALVFLAQIRASIASLEGSLTQELAKAKLTQISTQVNNAVELLKTQFETAEKVFDKTAKDIAKAAMMKWLMPLIGLLVAIVLLIVIVVLIVVTIVTGGATAPAVAGVAAALTGKMMGLIIAANVATLSVIIAAADLGSAVSSGKGIWDKLADAVGTTDPALKALLVTAIQFISDIIMIVATLGIGAGVVAVRAGVSAAMTMARQTMSLITSMSNVVGQIVIGSVISAIMSGGLITIGLAKLGQLMFGNEKDGNIFAIIMTVIIMIATCLIAKKASAPAPEKVATIATTAAGVGQAAGETTKISLDQVARVVATYLAKMLTGMGGATDEAIDISVMSLKECTVYILKLIKEIAVIFGTNFINSLKDTAQNIADVPGRLVYGFQRLALVFQSRQIWGAQTTFAQRLLEYLKEEGQGLAMNFQESIRLLTTGLQMYASYQEYKAAKVNEKFQTEMASLESITASLDAIIGMLGNMKGNDATRVIEGIAESAQEQSDRWASLVQLVESMINSASANVNKVVTV